MGTPVSVTRGTVGLSMTDTLMTSVQVCCSSHSCFKVKKEKYIYNTHFPVFKLILILTETVKYLCLWGPWWLSRLGILKPLGFSSDSGLRVMRSSPHLGFWTWVWSLLGNFFLPLPLPLLSWSYTLSQNERMNEWRNEWTESVHWKEFDSHSAPVSPLENLWRIYTSAKTRDERASLS